MGYLILALFTSILLLASGSLQRDNTSSAETYTQGTVNQQATDTGSGTWLTFRNFIVQLRGESTCWPRRITMPKTCHGVSFSLSWMPRQVFC